MEIIELEDKLSDMTSQLNGESETAASKRKSPAEGYLLSNKLMALTKEKVSACDS